MDVQPHGCNRAAAHNRIVEEPAMSKAKSFVGLDVHATKIVAAVLDAIRRSCSASR